MGVLLIRRLGRAAGSPGGRQAGGLAGGVLLERHAPPLPDRGGEGGTQIAASRSQRARARRPGAFFPLGLPGGGRPLCATFRDEKALSDSDLGFVPWPLAPSRQGGRPQPARLPHAGCCPCPGASTDGGGGGCHRHGLSPRGPWRRESFSPWECGLSQGQQDREGGRGGPFWAWAEAQRKEASVWCGGWCPEALSWEGRWSGLKWETGLWPCGGFEDLTERLSPT